MSKSFFIEARYETFEDEDNLSPDEVGDMLRRAGCIDVHVEEES